VLGSIALKNLQYNITNFLHRDASGVINFGAALVPRVAISHVFNNHFALRAGMSRGYSPPTNLQIKDAKGRIRYDVKAVKGIDYEIGSRGSFLNGAFSYDVTLFTFQARDQLAPQTVGQSQTIYVNAGKTSRVGLGAAFSYLWTGGSSSFISSVRPFVNYTYSHYTFTKFRKLGPQGQVIADFSGNQETGIAPHHLSAGLNITTRPGFFLNTSYYFNSREPITDANTVYLDAYSVLNAQLGYKRRLGSHFKVKIRGGVKNALNQLYSPFVALNAASHNGKSPAFYKPAPARNYYAGINLIYFIK
jgi:iron complex outermembrane receptor protein